MTDRRWVRKIVAGIVIGNLVILSTFFLFPRMQFLLAHRDLSSSLWMETTGSRDMPNPLFKTYAVVNHIAELTPVSATIFMPPGNRMQGSFRSATIQILYPRKVLFGEDENYASEMKKEEPSEASYFVYSREWKPEHCAGLPRIELTEFGFGMCRTNP
jgi:predicted TIM-barrel fold metal-dependent hydrolase